METVKIDIGNTAYTNIDEVSTRDGISPLLVDGYKNEVGSDIKRPGISLFADTNSAGGIDGLHWSRILQKFFVVSNGSIYTVSNVGVVADITNSCTMQVGTPVSFTEDGTRVFMANGGRIAYSTGGNCTFIADADAPTVCYSLAYIDGYILATDGETQVRFSAIDDYSTWATLDLFAAETSPDPIKAVRVANQEIYCFGSDTLDVFFNDGSTPFSRLSGGFAQTGTIARNTTVFINNTWMWLDQDKHIVILDGRTPKMISTPFDKEIQSYTTVSDAFAYRLLISGRDFYVINFPSADVTIVCDTSTGIWSQWGYWNTNTGAYNRTIFQHHVFIPEWNKHIVGDRLTGKLYEMSNDYYTDNGNIIRVVRRTGHSSLGGYGRKTMYTLTMKTKRGTGCGYTMDFDSGGTYEIQSGDIITGQTSSASATVRSVTLSSGSWALGTAVGTLIITHISGTFQNNELLNVGVNTDVATVDGTATFVGTTEPTMSIRFRDNNGAWTNERTVSLGASGDNEHLVRLTRCGQFRTRQIEFIHTDDSPYELINPIEAEVEAVD